MRLDPAGSGPRAGRRAGAWAWTLKSTPPRPREPLFLVVLIQKFQTHTHSPARGGRWFPRGQSAWEARSHGPAGAGFGSRRRALTAETGGGRNCAKNRKCCDKPKGAASSRPPAGVSGRLAAVAALAEEAQRGACSPERRPSSRRVPLPTADVRWRLCWLEPSGPCVRGPVSRCPLPCPPRPSSVPCVPICRRCGLGGAVTQSSPDGSRPPPPSPLLSVPFSKLLQI